MDLCLEKLLLAEKCLSAFKSASNVINKTIQKQKEISDEISIIKISGRIVKNKEDHLKWIHGLEQVCNLYENWASLYRLKTFLSEIDIEDQHELSEFSITAHIEMIKDYYNDKYDYISVSEDNEEPKSMKLIDDIEIKIAIYESCRNSRNSIFPFKGDSLSREITMKYLFELRRYGMPFRDTKCQNCNN
jgi:hypothetical protein